MRDDAYPSQKFREVICDAIEKGGGVVLPLRPP